MKSYLFSDPDPVSEVGRIYPYFRFDGYTNKRIQNEWDMIILENDYKKWVKALFIHDTNATDIKY